MYICIYIYIHICVRREMSAQLRNTMRESTHARCRERETHTKHARERGRALARGAPERERKRQNFGARNRTQTGCIT